jgi:uncharacterized protein YjdB
VLEKWRLPRLRQRPSAARLPLGVVAAGVLICVGGCLNDSLAPAGNTAQLHVPRVVAQVNAGEKATVVVDVGYWTSTEEVRPLPVTPSRIAIDAGATISLPIVVTLDPCIADPDAYHGGEGDSGGEGGCLLEVTFTLLDQANSEISSASTVVDFPVTPGQTIELEDVVLSNVWSVEVAPIDTLATGSVVTAAATARTKSGDIVSDASFIWHSYDTTVVSIDSTTGVIEARAPGNTFIEAVSDGVYGGIGVTVVDSVTLDVGAPGGICVTIDERTICPGKSGESANAVWRREGS